MMSGFLQKCPDFSQAYVLLISKMLIAFVEQQLSLYAVHRKEVELFLKGFYSDGPRGQAIHTGGKYLAPPDREKGVLSLKVWHCATHSCSG
jgi:hypothetical protein